MDCESCGSRYLDTLSLTFRVRRRSWWESTAVLVLLVVLILIFDLLFDKVIPGFGGSFVIAWLLMLSRPW